MDYTFRYIRLHDLIVLDISQKMREFQFQKIVWCFTTQPRRVSKVIILPDLD